MKGRPKEGADVEEREKTHYVGRIVTQKVNCDMHSREKKR